MGAGGEACRRHTLACVKIARLSAVALAGSLVACSSSADSEPPPATRATVAESVEETGDGGDAGTGLEPSGGTGSETEANALPSAGDAAPTPLDYSIVFDDIGGGSEAGWITVPVDYDDPQGSTLELWVVRHRADDDERVGVLFSNNGGPGAPASVMATNARGWFQDPLVDRFDIVSWDPRGTGRSGGSVDCIDGADYDLFFGSYDITPDDQAERDEIVDLSRTFAERCVEQVGDVLAHIGTNNSARDMDAIRQALGEEQASYFGYSYGSELGAVWATLFPDTVRAAVLDGAAHPDAEGLEPAKQQQLGFERVLNTFLAACSADDDCAFHNDGDAEGAFDALMESLDENPVPGSDGRAAVNQTIAITGVIQAMYTDRRWPALERALADAADGDGAGLLALNDSYFQRDPTTGEYTDLLESFQAISCADEADRLTVEEADAEAEELIGIAPRLFPGTTSQYTCDFFPPSADPRAVITGERAGPIVVIGTTGDPSTPLSSSEAMAAALEDGTLVTVEANRHTAYRSGSCIDDIVHDYLIWLDVPAADARCS